MTIVGQRRLFRRCEKIIVDRNDVPERCIDRIEFGLLTGIGEAIRQHALGNNARPSEQNIARVFQMSGRDAEAANRNKRVAAPIAEPGVAGDEGLSLAALDEICVGGAFERTGETFRRACSTVLTWAYRASMDSMWVVACPSAASISIAGPPATLCEALRAGL